MLKKQEKCKCTFCESFFILLCRIYVEKYLLYIMYMFRKNHDTLYLLHESRS